MQQELKLPSITSTLFARAAAEAEAINGPVQEMPCKFLRIPIASQTALYPNMGN